MDARNLADLYDLPLVDWAPIEAALDAGLTQAPGTGGPDHHTFWLATVDPDGRPHVTGIGGFFGRNTEGHVAIHGDPSASRLIHEGEVRLAREILVDLDEVRAAVDQLVHGCPGLIGRAHDSGVGTQRWIAVDARTVGEKAGAVQFARGQPALD